MIYWIPVIMTMMYLSSCIGLFCSLCLQLRQFCQRFWSLTSRISTDWPLKPSRVMHITHTPLLQTLNYVIHNWMSCYATYVSLTSECRVFESDDWMFFWLIWLIIGMHWLPVFWPITILLKSLTWQSWFWLILISKLFLFFMSEKSPNTATTLLSLQQSGDC